MTDREPLQRSDHSGRKPQITVCGRPLAPAQAVQSLSRATTRRMIGARRPANGAKQHVACESAVRNIGIA
jgi:hypothetical protein